MKRDVIIPAAVAVCLKLLLICWVSINNGFSINSWSQWDSHVYLTIAQQGYNAPGATGDLRDHLIQFPPFYSFCISILHSITRLDFALCGFLISFFCTILASILLYNLVLRDFADTRSALLSVFFMNIFPTSYFGMAVYGESMYMALILLAFYILLGERLIGSLWYFFLAVLTRLSGILLFPVFLVSIIKNFCRQEGRYILQYVATVFTFFAAIGLYLFINHHYHGDCLFFLRQYSANPCCGNSMAIPFQNQLLHLLRFIKYCFELKWDQLFMMTEVWPSIFIIMGVVLFFAGFKKDLPTEYHVYTASALIFFTAFKCGISDPRYMLSVFPIFIVLSKLNKTLQAIIGAAYVILLMYFSRLFTKGAWAF